MYRLLPAGALLALAAGLLLADAEPGSAETARLLARIKKVGREGAGNEDAAAAWKTLVQQGTSALVPILAAMHDDEHTAGNWLRPAFEAIAETALKDGKLSKDTLDKVIADQKLAGSARSLAYEWLVKLDRGAPDRLLPGMLKDPSAELRRLAVARVIDAAEAASTAKDTQTAKSLYEKALTGACDPEQVDSIARALEKLGTKVDLAKHHGFVQTWYLIAPFDHRKGIGWDVAYGPETEKEIDLGRRYKGTDDKVVKWVEHATTDRNGLVDLNVVLGKFKGAIAYAAAFIDSPVERTVELRAGCATGLKMFLNGKRIFALEEYHHGMRIDQFAARGTLRKGVNSLLLKVAQNEQKENWAQNWRFQIRLCDFIGARVAFTEVKKSLPAEGKQ